MTDPDQKAKLSKCPMCGNPAGPAYRPFCSRRCADVDLGRWLKGSYVVPGRDGDDEDGARPDEAPPDDSGNTSEQ